jgi:5-methylcytosine-specific restriction endonuclease McrA
MPQRIEMWRPPRAKHQIRVAESRPNAYRRGYTDGRHRAWRKAVLVRDAYTCRHCARVCGKKGEAHADHVSPVVAGTDHCVDGRSRYDVEVGQCLCAPCHQRKTNAEAVASRAS